jgi:hypothetical protein
MGKRADQLKKRKRQNTTASVPVKAAKATATSAPAPLTPPESEPSSDSLLLPEEMETAVFVLRALAENPALLSSKEMKELKRGVYDLHRVMVEGATLGASLTSRITAALKDYRFTDALVLLFEMYTRGMRPKLGALQRWVRECDATSAPDGSPGDAEALRCLDMILRIANMTDGAVEGAPAGKSVIARDHVRYSRVWEARPPITDGSEVPIWERMCADTLYGPAGTKPALPYPDFRVVNFITAVDRRPPNMYDSTVWGSSPGAIKLTSAGERKAPSRVDVPGVPGAFVVLDVFTPDECLQIIQAAQAIGFEKDQAAEGSAMLKTSILARNFVWLADKHFLDHFYGQIKPFVPPTAPVFDGVGGGSVRGINARFRVYQYNQNQLYRVSYDNTSNSNPSPTLMARGLPPACTRRQASTCTTLSLPRIRSGAATPCWSISTATFPRTLAAPPFSSPARRLASWTPLLSSRSRARCCVSVSRERPPASTLLCSTC